MLHPMFGVYRSWPLNVTAVLDGRMFSTSLLPSILFASKGYSWRAAHKLLLWGCKSAWVCLHAPNCTQSWHQCVVVHRKSAPCSGAFATTHSRTRHRVGLIHESLVKVISLLMSKALAVLQAGPLACQIFQRVLTAIRRH